MDYDTPPRVPPLREIPHYHGDAVRALLVVMAVVLIVGTGMGAELPLAALGSVAFAVVLVLAAGITNQVQRWIHWLNAALAGIGAALFGNSAVSWYRTGQVVGDPTSFVFALALALISLVTLYLTTRTIRGMMLRESR